MAEASTGTGSGAQSASASGDASASPSSAIARRGETTGVLQTEQGEQFVDSAADGVARQQEQ